MNLEALRERYGEFPVERRDWPVDAEEFARFASRGEAPVGAGVLVWDRAGRVLLVRESSGGPKAHRWATPGGFADAGESPEDCAIREAWEEAGVEVRLTGLTKVVLCLVANGGRTLPFAFVQFEGEAAPGAARAGPGIEEVRWHERLPEGMHFREDYEAPWRRRAGGARAASG